jgi:5-methylthioadenosine/S-adenosylhomocysteine deaminase
VRDVFVDGRLVVEHRRSTQIDQDALVDAVHEQHASLLARAGITVPHTWPSVPAT